jgi:hypothetical protein
MHPPTDVVNDSNSLEFPGPYKRQLSDDRMSAKRSSISKETTVSLAKRCNQFSKETTVSLAKRCNQFSKETVVSLAKRCNQFSKETVVSLAKDAASGISYHIHHN